MLCFWEASAVVQGWLSHGEQEAWALPERPACLLGDVWFLPLSQGWRKFFSHLSSGNISFLFPKSKDPFLVNVSSDDDHAGSYLCHHRGSYCK